MFMNYPIYSFGDIKMKLNEKFVTREMGDTQVMVGVGDASFSGVVRSNRTAAFIVDQLKTETTREQVADAMVKAYGITKEKALKDVEMILGKLRSIGALDE